MTNAQPLQLLVSVATAGEAAAALEGGADIVDAKDPRAGALGPVSLDTFRDIEQAVGSARPLSAALGDGHDEDAVEQAARTFAAHGAALVKLGFDPASTAGRITALIAAAVRGATAGGMASGVIAVIYADADTALSRLDFVDVAAQAGAAGVMLDTANKHGAPLRSILTPADLEAWVRRAHQKRMTAGIAGRLTAADVPFVRAARADVAGFRGAACEGGRFGIVTADKVRLLRQPVLFEADIVSS
jgi:dihydroneopterin aldolase